MMPVWNTVSFPDSFPSSI